MGVVSGPSIRGEEGLEGRCNSLIKMSSEKKDGEVAEVEAKEESKAMGIFWGVFKTVSLLTLLYIFICSITFLEDAFKLVSGKNAGAIFGGEIMKNPIVGLMIGILFTVLVQSSSTCTSVIVSLVAAGGLKVKEAIPMVMGANIGTSMTSTLVSLTQVTDVEQFERAFSAATVHDCFNWSSVIVCLILELSTHYLYELTTVIVGDGSGGSGSDISIPDIFGYFVTPFTDLVIQVNDTVLEHWGANDPAFENVTTLLPEYPSVEFLFDLGKDGWSDQAIGGLLLVIALLLMSFALVLIVKVLRSSLEGGVAKLIKKFVNADIKYVPWLTGYIALAMGAVLTFVVQSSSVFTSTLTPLVGVGLIEVDRMYPLVLGANIGTTSTALIAALAAHKKDALQIALCHFFFNISGILLFYPIPFTRIPLPLCKLLGRTVAKYRWFAIFYLFMMFFALPAAILGLSIIPGTETIPLYVVGGLFVIIVVFAIVVNLMQDKCPKYLPKILRTWDFLPLWMRSLEPLDTGCMFVLKYCFICCPKFYNSLKTELPPPMTSDVETGPVVTTQPMSEKGQDNPALEMSDEKKTS